MYYYRSLGHQYLLSTTYAVAFVKLSTTVKLTTESTTQDHLRIKEAAKSARLRASPLQDCTRRRSIANPRIRAVALA